MSGQLNKKLFAYVGALVSVVIVAVALTVMYHTLQTISFSDVLHSLESLSFFSILLGIIITALSYFVITGYDVVALNHIGRHVRYPRAALSAFLASTFGNNIGFAVLTGTSIRYRIYAPIGLSAMDIAGVSTMCALTTMLGMAVIFSLTIILQSEEAATTGFRLGIGYMQFVAVAILTAITSYVVYSNYKPVTLRTASWSFKLPSAKTTLIQIALATTNLSLVGTLIYVLLPDGIDTNYIAFLSVFALALIAGSASNVPGGIGVFESVILLGLPQIPPAALLGSIILFRCIYYLSPLAIAAVLLVYHEVSKQQGRLEELHESTLDVLDEVGPQIMAMLILLAGVILLFSGSIPAGFDRDHSFIYVPLLTVELSHLLGAATGIGLIIAARGISRRLTAAFYLALKLLALGVVTSLLKGFGIKEALVLSVILGVLWYTRSEFRRSASLLGEGFTVEWVSLISVLLAVTIWLGLFSFKGVPYSNSLWWTFAFDSDYSRFLRSLLVVFGISGAVTSYSFLRPDPVPGLPEVAILEHVRRILLSTNSIYANLVLLGDKRLLFSHSGDSFLMYQIQGKSWVALGDPVGPKAEYEDLIWSFRALCDRYGGWPVFYMVDESKLPFYGKLDLSIERMADEVVMPLENFMLSGAMQTELIEVHDRVGKKNATHEVIAGEELSRVMPELKQVSDDWLSSTQTGEMGFSRGFFDAYYVKNFSCSIVRIESQIMAFAVMWTTPDNSEIGLDLMRNRSDAPKNIMDYLIIETMLWAKEQKIRWFDLGIAPLPELKHHPLAPLWHRSSVLMYGQSYAENESNNAAFREKHFKPVWRPKYLVSPGGIKTPRILRDINRLISQRNVHTRPEEKQA